MPATDLALLKEAAREAGAIASRFFDGTPQVWDKPLGAGPVTEADLAVNVMLHRDLMLARPGYGWLSEETEDTAARLSAERLFVIDPIDGTRAFIEGSRDWAHSFAIVERGQVTAAVVYLPMRKLMYTAQRGLGAHLNGKPIFAPSTTRLDGAGILAARPNFEAVHWKNLTPPNVKRTFRSSLAYRLCLVADGQFDAMITLRPSWEWDIAAGSLIVTEARGKASDRTGGLLAFNNVHPQVNGVVAAGGVHSALIDCLA